MLLPFQATSVPQYLTLDALDILDTGKAVILPCAYGAFGTFLLTQFMRGIDGEILEAARLDGVGNFSLLWRIVLPLCKPAVVSVLVLQFISFWSMVDQPVLFLQSEQLMPLSVKPQWPVLQLVGLCSRCSLCSCAGAGLSILPGRFGARY